MYTFQSRHIVVEGVIGAGKTSLALQLSKRYKARVLLEVVEENPFLSQFYDNPIDYAFRTQVFFLLSRYNQQTKAARQNIFKELSFSDYMFDKDRIFAHLNLTGSELNMYEQMYDIMYKDIVLPDLIIYLRASTKLLMKRIVLRDRPFERKISIQYLDRLNNYYEDYFRNIDNFPCSRLLIIDTNELDFIENKADFEFICEQILNKEKEKKR